MATLGPRLAGDHAFERIRPHRLLAERARGRMGATGRRRQDGAGARAAGRARVPAPRQRLATLKAEAGCGRDTGARIF
jgi:hypothetical protein